MAQLMNKMDKVKFFAVFAGVLMIVTGIVLTLLCIVYWGNPEENGQITCGGDLLPFAILPILFGFPFVIAGYYRGTI